MTSTMKPVKPYLMRLALPLAAVGVGVAAWAMLTPKPLFETQGLIQAEEVRLASTQGGKVETVYVSEGQTVSPNTLLIRFEDDLLANKLEDAQNAVKQAQLAYRQLTQKASPRDIQQAQARVQQARQQLQLLLDGPSADTLSQAKARQAELQGQLALARQDLKQAEAQVAAGVLANAKLDTLKTQIATLQNSLNAARATVSVVQAGAKPEQRAIARAELSAAEAQLGKLRDGARPVDIQLAAANVEKAQIAAHAVAENLDDLTLKAPIEGVVGVVNAQPGELVQPGKPIITLVNLKRAWVDIYVPERLLPQLTLNMKLALRSATYPGQTFNGQVVFISPKSEFIPAAGSSGDAQESATFRVKLALNEEAITKLRPGMKVTVTL